MGRGFKEQLFFAAVEKGRSPCGASATSGWQSSGGSIVDTERSASVMGQNFAPGQP